MQIPPGGNPFDVLSALLQSMGGDEGPAPPGKRTANPGDATQISAWRPAAGAAPVHDAGEGSAPYPLLGGQFDPRQAHALFDLGQLLGKVFSVIESLVAAVPAAPAAPPRRHGSGGRVTTSSGNWAPAQPAAAGSVIGGLQAKASVGDTHSIRASGQLDAGAATLSGAAEASAYRGAGVQGQITAGGGHVGASGSAAAEVGARASAEGRIDTDLGSIDGRAEATAELYARAEGYVDASLTGAEAGASAETGATVKARAEANANLVGGLVTGHADAFAESGSGATAEGRVGLQFSPPTAVLDGSAGAFAGARAGFSAKGGVSGASYGAEGEAWAGVGAKAEFSGGIDDGVFHFTTGIGAALGVGAFLRVDVELDLRDPAKVAGGLLAAAGAVVGLATGGLGGAVVGALASGTGGKGVGDLLGGLFGSVAGLFGGGQGDGTHAHAALSEALQQLPAPFSGVPGLAGAPPGRTTSVWKSDENVDPRRAASFEERFEDLTDRSRK